MPVNRKVMKRLKEEYGEEKGVDVYHALLKKGRIMEMRKGNAAGHGAKGGGNRRRTHK